jgi:hypothetical protein
MLIRILANIGFVMALIGGLIFIFLGIAGVFGIFWLIFYPVFSITAFFWGITMIIAGLIVIGGSRWVHRIPTAILLLLIGIFVSLIGAWFAAWLVIIGALLGMVSRL